MKEVKRLLHHRDFAIRYPALHGQFNEDGPPWNLLSENELSAYRRSKEGIRKLAEVDAKIAALFPSNPPGKHPPPELRGIRRDDPDDELVREYRDENRGPSLDCCAPSNLAWEDV